MNRIINKIDALSVTKVYMPLILIGMLLAAQIQYIQHGWINPDSVLYFESAKLFTEGDWQAAVKVFNWPLYAICIAVVHKITSLSIHTSAQLLSVIFFGITTASFLKIITLARGTVRTMFAGALILFSSQYLVGDVLEMLLRDQGFWAFYLTSLVFFIKFYQSKSYTNALLWQISAIIATLFRIEAITFLLFLPMLLLINKEESWRQRITDFIKCHLLNIIVAFSVLVAIAISDITISQLGRLKEVFSANLFTELTHKFFTQSSVMSTLVLGKYLEEFAIQGLLLTFIYVMIAKTITTAGLVNLGLALYTYRARKHLMNAQAFNVLKATAVIALVNMALIITKVFVLSGRYVIALGLIVMLFASFKLADLSKHLNTALTNKEKKLKWIAVAITVIMLLGIVKNILPKAEGYNYLQESAAWVKKYNIDNKSVFYDETRIRYYLDEPFTHKWGDTWNVVTTAVNDNTINNYDLLMISHTRKHPEYETYISDQLPDYVQVKRFSSVKKNKSIVIYEKRYPTNHP